MNVNNNPVTVISGGSSDNLAGKIATRLGAEFIKPEFKVFSDGETKITLPDGKYGDRIVVVGSTCPPVDTNLIRLMSLVSESRRFSNDVVLVVPYMGYSRQDKKSFPGEIVTLSVVADILKSSGASDIVTVDLHSELGMEIFQGSIKNVSAIPYLVDEIRKYGLTNPIVVSPDEGGISRSAEFSNLYKSEHVNLKKNRDRKTGEIKIESENTMSFDGRDVVLVDDMITTGGSMAKSAELLKGLGCGRIIAACTHAVLVGGAEGRIMGAGVERIVSTNTVPGPTSVVDVSKAIADVI